MINVKRETFETKRKLFFFRLNRKYISLAVEALRNAHMKVSASNNKR